MSDKRSAISCQQSAISYQQEAGFTMVELMITMTIVVLVIAGASQIFTGLLTQFKQQSKIGESNIEGIIGLEILRKDIEHAGFGLPWNISGISYSEAVNDNSTSWDDTSFNDASSNPPRPIFSGNDINGSLLSSYKSDVLVIKASNVGRSDVSQMWTELNVGNIKGKCCADSTAASCESPVRGCADDLSCTNSTYPKCVGLSGPNESFGSDNYVIVISPGSTDADSRKLSTYVYNGNTYWKTTYGSTTGFAPSESTETRVIYGIDPDTDLRMPFNRADYFVKRPSSNMPSRCAPNTGVLYKAVIIHGTSSSAGKHDEFPLLDCVADMQVKFLAADSDGNIQWPPSDDLMASVGALADACGTDNACKIRTHLTEVRVYIVAQEGQKDMTYDFSINNREYLSATIINPSNVTQSTSFDFVNLKTLIGDPEYKFYRWKLYTLVVKPKNLR